MWCGQGRLDCDANITYLNEYALVHSYLLRKTIIAGEVSNRLLYHDASPVAAYISPKCSANRQVFLLQELYKVHEE